MTKRRVGTRWIPLILLLAATPVRGQDSNIMAPADSLERLLLAGMFDVVDSRGARFEGDRTDRAVLKFGDGTMIGAKLAPAMQGGEGFNNQPRYEAAAYELQKLFLDEPDYVVPPTVLRAFPIEWYRRLDPATEPTFSDTRSVVVTLQYWLFNVTGDDFWNEDRFEADTAYARHFADFNIVTYLIRHNDANQGNFLISSDPANPRVFAVDNGLAFSSVTSDRGARWRQMRVRSLPRATVERLRALTEEDLRRQLATVAQFRVGPDGRLEPVEPTAPLEDGDGVRVEDGIVQFGLTEREIREVWRRIESLLEDVEDGDYRLF